MPTPTTPPDEFHTYEEWQQLGYQVQRGEHATRRSDRGVALFGPRQVRPRILRPTPPGEYRPPARRRPRPDVQPVRAAPPVSWEEQLRRVRDLEEEYSGIGRTFTAPAAPSSWLSSSSNRMYWRNNASTDMTYGFGVSAQPVTIFMDEVVELPAPKLLQRAVSDYAPQDEPTGFQKFARKTK